MRRNADTRQLALSLGVTLPRMAHSSMRGWFAQASVAERALRVQGYANIEIVDRVYPLVGLRGCDGGDAARFTVRALNPRGQRVLLQL